MPKQVKVRAAQDEKEERMVRELAHSSHVSVDLVNHARMVVESWAGKSPNEIAAELACQPQMVRTHLARFNAKGIEGLGTSRLEDVLRLLAHNQDEEALRDYENSPTLLSSASLERVLASLLNTAPMSFLDRNEFAQKLKQAYQRMPKNVTAALDKLRGAIGFVCFTLELLNIAEKQNQDLDSPNKLLEDPPVRDWFKEVYTPPSRNPVTTQNSPTKKQEEEAKAKENLRVARGYWQELNLKDPLDPDNPDPLVVYRVGTTSFILRCQINTLPGEKLVLKCLLFPYTGIDDIAEATRNYALEYAAGTVPGTARVLSSTDKWILMDFITGLTLQELLEERRESERKAPRLLRTDLLALISQPLLKALGSLSNVGKQHEDLTPSNIILHKRSDGSIEIIFIDLGRNYLYTSHLGLEASREALFVAPEVKNMEDSDTVSLYSFGMILIDLADPIGVQGHTIPDSLYQYMPHLARFIEDLIDKKPKNRLLIFPPIDRKDLYPQLCSILSYLLQVLPSESEVKPGRFFWVKQFIALFYPKNRLTHAWKLWHIMHPDFRWKKFWRVLRPFPARPAIAKFTGRLYGWLVVSTASFWLIFLVSIIWGARDFGMNPFTPFWISIPQTLLPNCRGICLPVPPGYVFDITNMQARLVGFSSGLAHSVYYANILAGLTTRPMSRSTLARVTELFMRAFTISYLPLVLIGNLYQPALWPVMLLIGLTIPALTNILSYHLAIRTIKEARGVFSTVPVYDPSLKNFGQWGTTLSCYIIMVFFIWLGMQNNLLHDVWAYAIGAVVINVFIFCFSKSIILASGVRGSLCRAFTLGERLEAVAQNLAVKYHLATKYHLSSDSQGNAMRVICALHQGTFKGTIAGGMPVTASQAYSYGEIDQLLILAQYLAEDDSANVDGKLSDANVSSYLANALHACGSSPLETYLQTTIPNYHSGNKPIGTPTPHH